MDRLEKAAALEYKYGVNNDYTDDEEDSELVLLNE